MTALLYQKLISDGSNCIEEKLHELLNVVNTIEQEFRNYNFYPYLADLKILREAYRNFLYKKEFSFEICERLGIASKVFYKRDAQIEKIIEYSIPLLDSTIKVGENIQEEILSKNKIIINKENLLSEKQGVVSYFHRGTENNYYFNFMMVPNSSKKPTLIMTGWQLGVVENSCKVELDFWLLEESALDLVKAYIAKKIWGHHKIQEENWTS